MIALLPLIIGGIAFVLMQKALDVGAGTLYLLTSLIVIGGYAIIIRRVAQTQSSRHNALGFYKIDPTTGKKLYHGNASFYQGAENMLGESYLKIRLRRLGELLGQPYPLNVSLYLNGRHIKDVVVEGESEKQRLQYDEMLETPDFNSGSTLEVRHNEKTVLQGRFGSNI